ncbi:unnamed protein product [Bemisia tabaci]|uniref:Methyltransferase type 11 domain-containing protein n=1 Tax=Bemisia tabaci TaxID=7038 RepID=A0A9P0F2Y6_BEMTA|nr:unnamed protein product [Bemisia tabaci]
MGEREARSVALEKAYVHEVYQQMTKAEHPHHETNSPWPRIKQLIEQLEPGSLVCDVGCGNGKYLSMNSSVFKIGGERCSRLAHVARQKENEIIICDNLALPFRDESFDAVLSIAVVHHLATTERRVCALKELTRVLRIGGKLIITVWAMEQRHRKFESQDVLVPWHRPQVLSTPSFDSWQTTTSEDDCPPPYAYIQASDSDSTWLQRAHCRAKKDKGRQKGRSEVMRSSPSSSSLSSPNETCYSFVRKALQKLAGGKRGSRSRGWFLEPWTSTQSEEIPMKRYDPEGCEDTEDIQDLPIELRRLDEDVETALEKRQNFAATRQASEHLNYKSKSLSDIGTQPREEAPEPLTRSRSSVPSLSLELRPEISVEAPQVDPAEERAPAKPRLVKQKKSICDEDFEEEDRDKPTDMRDLVKAMPEFKVASQARLRETLFNKQVSMNEELMSTERMREKEKVRQNIQKQASLNEDLIFRRRAPRTIDSLRNSFFSTSTSTAKRFQLLKSGLTSKLKSSTTNIEKAVTSSTFKNGFVRMLQGWKSDAPIPQPAPPPPHPMPPPVEAVISEDRTSVERRHSKEDGSDSSKDSSLQSDTSVDSEDSFASVIYIPKPEEVLHMEQSVTSPTLLASNPVSPQATSPKLKFPPQPISPKLGVSRSPKSPKSPQSSFGLYSHPSSPKIKQIPALQSTSTPASPMLKHFPQPLSPRPFYAIFPSSKQSPLVKPCDSPVQKIFQQIHPMLKSPKSPVSPPVMSTLVDVEEAALEPMRLSPTPASRRNMQSPKEDIDKEPAVTPKEETPVESELVLSPSPSVSITKDPVETDPQRKDEKDETKTSSVRPVSMSELTVRTAFPLVRRSTEEGGDGDVAGALALVTRQPNLLSLELFNPETDDVDSDSSGLSSSGSIGSVISVLNEELPPDLPPQDAMAGRLTDITTDSSKSKSSNSSLPTSSELDLEFQSDATSPPSGLIEAAAGVASCLEETVDTVLKSSPRSKRKQLHNASTDISLALGSVYTRQDLEKTVGPSEEDLDITDDDKVSKDHQGARNEEKGTRSQSGVCQRSHSERLGTWGNEPSDWNEGKGTRQQGTTRDSERPVNIKAKMEGVVITNRSTNLPDADSEWGQGRQQMVEFAEKLSEKLRAEIDKNQEREIIDVESIPASMEDPYIQRLNKELENLNELSQEIHSTLWRRGLDEEPAKRSEGKLPLDVPSDETADVDKAQEQHTMVKTMMADSEESKISKTEPSHKSSVTTAIEGGAKSGDASADSSGESSEAEAGSWADSRRNTITSRTDSKLRTAEARTSIESQDIKPESVINAAEKPKAPRIPEMKRIELLSGSEVSPRRPSISVETTEPCGRIVAGKSEEMLPEMTALQSTLSVESSEAGDISDRTVGSSSDGSRSESRRGTIVPTETSGIMSLRPGLSLESSEAGESGSVSDISRAGDSTKNTISFDEPPSGSQISLLRPGASIESSEYGDISDRTASGSETKGSSFGAAKTDSTASLTSDRWSDCSKDIKFADRKIARCDGRSSSEETVPRRASLIHQRASIPCPQATDKVEAESTDTSMSDSTSQDSMMSDCAGGSITFHRYYHVFKEGELDQLIESYIDNLHIISSYYDHANWCVVAEKVQVWTI